MMCVFGRLMSQLAEVNIHPSVGMFAFIMSHIGLVVYFLCRLLDCVYRVCEKIDCFYSSHATFLT